MLQIKQVELSDWSMSLKVIHGELWSCKTDGITIFDKELKQKRSMRGHDNFPGVYSVALLPDDTVVVAGWQHLYQISKSGWNTFYDIIVMLCQLAI